MSGLIYQVVWVRAFGNVFGNTIHSASLVVAVFMLGLGVAVVSSGRGRIGDTPRAPSSLLRAYGHAELAIALLGFLVSMTVAPRHAGGAVSFYSRAQTAGTSHR